MPNAIMRGPTATSSNAKGGDNTSLHNEISSQVPEMIKILKQMAAILEMINTRVLKNNMMRIYSALEQKIGMQRVNN
ncbi:hypothetical protein AJ78_02303 [Emergomyces pasteurianus Ep9510]|uniref:Uncharacterized protein n=1 Tax=Emergomyces pasteurianus Ep9510 TaxID=1447872 RepID=A0A1J9QP07_9EURO|nr:hypothetical protein AJ78_02303 [Emergomyces pasteurianus Ep9510]